MSPRGLAGRGETDMLALATEGYRLQMRCQMGDQDAVRDVLTLAGALGAVGARATARLHPDSPPSVAAEAVHEMLQHIEQRLLSD